MDLFSIKMMNGKVLIVVCSFVTRGYREDRARLFLEVHSRRTSSNGQLQHRKTQLEKMFSPQQQSNTESREIVASSPLEIFKTLLEKVLANLT